MTNEPYIKSDITQIQHITQECISIQRGQSWKIELSENNSYEVEQIRMDEDIK
jgi:hypothetical protein